MRTPVLICFVLVAISVARGADAPATHRFDFGPAPAAGFVRVSSDTIYSAERGYGFEPGATVQAVESGPAGAPHRGFVTAAAPFRFSVAVPEGNYRVTVTLGDAAGEATTTVKAEARRLMLERIHTAAGEFVTLSFNVSVRRPVLPDGTKLTLDVQEINAQGELLSPTWDDKLTLQFSDARPAVAAVTVEPAPPGLTTVFLMSDSTVTDQRTEPYGTWGQMLPRWFGPGVVVANYAESGETLKAFRAEHRFEKILSQLQPGDYVLMQFGTNDLNKTGPNAIWPEGYPLRDWSNSYVEGEDYKNQLKQYAAEVKAHGGIPVIVSPMTKIDRTSGAINVNGLRHYPQDAMDAAKEAGVASIDLNALSIAVWQGLGPALAPRGTVDGLHSNTYGGYLLSRCIVEGLRQAKLGLAKFLVDDVGTFDPKHPQPLPDDFKIPLEPRPAGGPGGRRGRGGPAAPATPAATQPAAPATAPSASPAPAPAQ